MDPFVSGIVLKKRQIEVDVNKEKSGRKKIRKCDNNYLKFGLTVAEGKGVEHRQCVICCKVLAAECTVCYLVN